MKSDMINFQHSFFNCDPLSHTVQKNWDILNSEIKALVNKHIPTKMTCSKHINPWITKEIRRMCRKKQRLYNKAQASENNEDRKSYKNFKKLTQTPYKYWSFKNNMFQNLMTNPTKPSGASLNQRNRTPPISRP